MAILITNESLLDDTALLVALLNVARTRCGCTSHIRAFATFKYIFDVVVWHCCFLWHARVILVSHISMSLAISNIGRWLQRSMIILRIQTFVRIDMIRKIYFINFICRDSFIHRKCKHLSECKSCNLAIPTDVSFELLSLKWLKTKILVAKEAIPLK